MEEGIMETGEILAVGPRELPQNGTVQVWVDAGSGSSGQRIVVPVTSLQPDDNDHGEGKTALYILRMHP
ncbi:hypothetical protein ACN28G_23680 [Micromonospora sp. WMMA1923]|uniref:hypothetical protein n=1 Tax=Micromonospora sp. WMMA1923 TaxID=3404125 RepID=UPI003B94A4F9